MRVARCGEDDVVLEIGPGSGALTNALLGTGAYVIAVEKDESLIPRLKERFEGNQRLQIENCDILKFDVREKVSEAIRLHGKKRAIVVSNLPFNVTSDVLRKLLPMGDLFKKCVVMLQVNLT